MGRIFLDHLGGQRIFSCANCDTPLTNRSELVSTRFTGATGRAFLFNHVVNTKANSVQERVKRFRCFSSLSNELSSFVRLDDVNWSTFRSRC